MAQELMVLGRNGQSNRWGSMVRGARFAAEAECRERDRDGQDELDAAVLADRDAAAQRAMEKYRKGLKDLEGIFHQIEGDASLIAAEKAVMERSAKDRQTIMQATLMEFCGEGIDVAEIVANDVVSVRELVRSHYGDRRGQHAEGQVRDDQGKFSGGFAEDVA